LAVDDGPATVATVPRATATGTSSTRGPAVSPDSFSDSFDEGRFLPGTMLAGRYRVVGVVGRGGMGEVYRADDLRLGQTVALKFLPEELEQDPSRLSRFFNEVRTARQVTHPNVCRVHDTGEFEGHHFISMEYVDGEDLNSLLRRIGRLPREKAVQIARQLCAGLAAAHEQGILHRDLKPANVMVDGRGRVRITDFGLAGLAEEFRGEEIRVGTPRYMAPEQIAGEQVSVRSDIYALGLVLYELFTGKRAYEARSPTELQRMQESSPTSPSSLVDGLDPSVERAILRCLEKDPARRPANALAVSAALPGGDPLAEALAAGETPSPEMVAEAGGKGGLRPIIALGCLAIFLVGLIVNAYLESRTSLFRYVNLDKPPQVLAERAREIVADFGYTEPPVDSAYGFDRSEDYVEHIREEDKSPDRWNALSAGQPPVLTFWYRQSPRHLISDRPAVRVGPETPRRGVSGMTNAWLDPVGRLLRFLAVPRQVDGPGEPPAEFDWSVLLAAMGLDEENLTPVESTWVPHDFADTRVAWTGVYPDNPEIEIRIEAAAYRGKPVYLETIDPWLRPWRMQQDEESAGEKAVEIIALVLLLAIIVGSVLLARRNFRLGRGDRKGAFRVATIFFVVSGLAWMITADHVPDLAGETFMLIFFFGMNLFWAVLIGLMYVALEPFVRRHWPHALVSWNRLLAGRFRDPLVGRHILVGAVFFSVVRMISRLTVLAEGWFDLPPEVPFGFPVDALRSGRHLVGTMLEGSISALITPVGILFVVLILRVLLRRQWLAIGGLVALIGIINVLVAENPLIAGPAAVILVSLMVAMLIRFGLLALGAGTFLGGLSFMPLTLDFSAWYAPVALIPTLVALAVVLFAFYTSLAGRPLFADDPLAEGPATSS
jgi:serine/threonine-protein kinase